MRPNDTMIATCERALAWYDENPELREHCEPWMVRFARGVRSPKLWASIMRCHEWYKANSGFRGAPGFFGDTPTAERLAWSLLGGDAGERWAADAVAAGPAEHSSISDTYDMLEAEADERERLAAFSLGGGQSMRLEDWADPEAFASFEGRNAEWSGVLCLEGVATSDNRFIVEGALTWRELPITLQDQLMSQDGHDGAVPVGPITNVYRLERDGGGYHIMGEGLFDTGQHGMDARRRMAEGTKQGVSVDLTEVVLDLPEDEEAIAEILFGGGELRITSARIGAATLVTIPAFEGARLQVMGDIPASVTADALVASGGRLDGVTLRAVMPFTSWIAEAPTVETAVATCTEFRVDAEVVTCSHCGHTLEEHMPEPVETEPAEQEMAAEQGAVIYMPSSTTSTYANGVWTPTGANTTTATITLTTPPADETLVASGALRPPADWFDQFTYPTVQPVTVMEPNELGLRQIHGHVAAWGSCHVGFQGRCVDVPRGLDYSSFQGDRVPQQVTCSDGTVVKAGPVVMDTVHPNLKATASDAAAHYAHTGSLAAQVRLYEDKFGLQLRGWVMPGLSDEHLARLSASDYSPDWRPRASANGGRGVVCVLAVPVSGFNLGLVASGAEQEDGPVDDLAIIGSTWTPHAAALAGRKVEALRRLGRPVPAEVEVLAASIEPPELSARKTAVLARLGLVEDCGCGCGGEGRSVG